MSYLLAPNEISQPSLLCSRREKLRKYSKVGRKKIIRSPHLPPQVVWSRPSSWTGFLTLSTTSTPPCPMRSFDAPTLSSPDWRLLPLWTVASAFEKCGYCSITFWHARFWESTRKRIRSSKFGFTFGQNTKQSLIGWTYWWLRCKRRQTGEEHALESFTFN